MSAVPTLDFDQIEPIQVSAKINTVENGLFGLNMHEGHTGKLTYHKVTLNL